MPRYYGGCFQLYYCRLEPPVTFRGEGHGYFSRMNDGFVPSSEHFRASVFHVSAMPVCDSVPIWDRNWVHRPYGIPLAKMSPGWGAITHDRYIGSMRGSLSGLRYTHVSLSGSGGGSGTWTGGGFLHRRFRILNIITPITTIVMTTAPPRTPPTTAANRGVSSINKQQTRFNELLVPFLKFYSINIKSEYN